jgi:hypothetical protein
MARALTTAQTRALGLPDYITRSAFFVRRKTDGSWVALHDLDGYNWVKTWSWKDDVDTSITQLDLDLFRNRYWLSLATLVETSKFNRNEIGSYVPLIEPGLEIQQWTAVMGVGVGAISTDWVRVFHGEIDDVVVTPGEALVRVTARDLMCRLHDRYIKEPFDCYPPSGQSTDAVQNRIAKLITDFGPTPTMPLVTPTSPGWNIGGYTQDAMTVLEAVNKLAEQIGWMVKFKWNAAADDFRLTFFRPGVTAGSGNSVLTITPAMVLEKSDLSLSREGVRNSWKIIFRTASGAVNERTLTDSESITRYGERWASVQEDDESSLIRTNAEADRLLAALIADTRDPKADYGLTLRYRPDLEVGDVVTVVADGTNFTTNQVLAIVGIEHGMNDSGEVTTSLTLRGSPSGGFRRWLTKAVVERESYIAGPPLHAHTLKSRTATGEMWTFNGTLAPKALGPVMARLESENAAGVTTVLKAWTAVPFDHTFAANDGVGVRVRVRLRDSRVLTEASPVFVPVFSAQPPVADIRWKDDGVKLTAWLDLHLRGMAPTAINGLRQVGAGSIVTSAGTTRTAGATSAVTGTALGTWQREHEANLDTYRTSRIGFEVVLPTGEKLTFWTPAHDKNRVPEFATLPRVTGTVVTVEGDQDTMAFRVERIDGGGTWQRTVDNWSGTVDVALPGTGGSAGLGAGQTAMYRVTLFSDPAADVDSNTLTSTADVTVTTGAPPSGTPAWTEVSLTVPQVGSDILGINLEATSAPSGSSVTVEVREQIGGGRWTSFYDITSSIGAGAVPTSVTLYGFYTGHFRQLKGFSNPVYTIEVTARIHSGGVVVAMQTVTANWYTDELMQ